jgi:hypothetical protein
VRFENFAGTDEQGKPIKDEMKEVRVSDATRNAAHGKDSLIGLSLGGLQEERVRLLADKDKVELALAELNERFTTEQMRIRRQHGNRNSQESITAWLARRKELNRERKRLVLEKKGIERQVTDVKDQIQHLTGTNHPATRHDGIKGGYLDKRQMQQYTEGLRTVIQAEFGSLVDIRSFLDHFSKLQDRHRRVVRGLAKIKEEYAEIGDNPHALLKLAYNLLQALGERCGWDKVTPEEKQAMAVINSYLLLCTTIPDTE